MRTRIILVALLLLAVLPAFAEEPTPVPSCGDCHDEQFKAFSTNPHGHGLQLTNAVCEKCHGDGKAHIEAGGDKSLIFKPLGLTGSDKTCLTCHDVKKHGGPHANSSTVNCLTCHSIHASKAMPLLARPQLALCNTCHSTQVASFRNKPYAHRLGSGGMECSSCHDPHVPKLRRTRSGELPCVNCHTEKRGPFVFQHGAAAIGDCMTCHEPHGSSNRNRLIRANTAQLCLECHSPIGGNTLGSQPPSFHNLSLARYQNCTTCHVAVHGSNRDPQLMK